MTRPEPGPGTPPPALDEPARRRPDFLPGPVVTLADGQGWTLPRASCYYEPAEDDDGFAQRWNLGPDYDALVRARDAAPTGSAIVRAEIALARWLLGRNYDLDPAEVRSLLRFGYGPGSDPGHVAIREAVVAAAMGVADRPKAGAAG